MNKTGKTTGGKPTIKGICPTQTAAGQADRSGGTHVHAQLGVPEVVLGPLHGDKGRPQRVGDVGALFQHVLDDPPDLRVGALHRDEL